MKAIILAAGRGSRMKERTDDQPKCMIKLMDKPLLHWQLGALRKGGVDDILVVRGYLAEKLQGDFSTIDNPYWDKSNMVETLRQAAPWLTDEPCIVSYSDIVYHPDHVKAISESEYDIAMTYDTMWRKLWELRFADPLSDAETFFQENGTLKEIGQTALDYSQIQGQFMGLMRFTPKGWKTISDLLDTLGRDKVAKLDMTALFNLLIKEKINIGVIAVEGKWCEADSASDINAYEKQILKHSASHSTWSHDWR
ncbi:phosphocholine cytidylyltransferase family protein [Maridesulfovibrio sp.]|uniref:phosphocholine cytidylyltransferase family protein n=1 Tax=Maridesulfovibrio sp. TaxID=2795000 RepID=UPI003BAD9A56